MKKLFILLLSIVIVTAFNNNNVIAQKTKSNNTKTSSKKKRNLRYVFYANGGLLGYFNDGTVAGCPRCEFDKENLEVLFKTKPSKKYKVRPDGSLLVDGVAVEHPSKKVNQAGEHWPLIDYVWNEKVPQ